MVREIVLAMRLYTTISEDAYGKQEYTMAAEVKVQEFMIFVTLTVFIVSATGSKKDRISMR